MKITVGIVEDNQSIREGIVSLLNATSDFECRWAFESCEDAIDGLADRSPDIILMDINLGEGMSGIDGVRNLKSRFPGLNVVMLTVYEDSERIFQSLCAGATGYLLKNTPPDRLIEALREVHAGGSPMTASIARKVLDRFLTFAPVPLTDFGLSPREGEILNHLVRGSSYKMIARDLFISIDTVSTHIRKIY